MDYSQYHCFRIERVRPANLPRGSQVAGFPPMSDDDLEKAQLLAEKGQKDKTKQTQHETRQDIELRLIDKYMGINGEEDEENSNEDFEESRFDTDSET
jgi:hypothetical protein